MLDVKLRNELEMTNLLLRLKEKARSFEVDATNTVYAVALETAIELRKSIRREPSQIKLRLRKLDPGYVEQKKQLGLMESPLAATGEFANSITVDKKRTTKGGRGFATIRIFVPGGKQHSHSKLSMSKIARYLEYGTRKVAPLPYWKTAKRFAQKKVKEHLPMLFDLRPGREKDIAKLAKKFTKQSLAPKPVRSRKQSGRITLTLSKG